MRLLMLLSVASSLFAQSTGTIPAHPMLRITTMGDLIVRGVKGDVLRYKSAQTTAPRVEGMRVTFTEPGTVHLEIPRGTRLLQLITQSGTIDVADLDGAVRADVMAGKVVVDRIAGDVEIHSAGGPAFIGSVGGLVKCYSAGGAIHAAMVHGQGIFETGGGDIQLGQVLGAIRAITAGGGIQIQRAGGDVYADTFGGPIEILRALGMVVAKSAAGPIQIDDAGSVQCKSNSGTIRLNNASGRLLASTMHGSIVAEILAGHPMQDSYLSTASGDISVSIPSNVGVTVQAECDSGGNRRAFLSEFPGMQVFERGGTLIVRGLVNGGGPVLRLSDVGGRIELKKK